MPPPFDLGGDIRGEDFGPENSWEEEEEEDRVENVRVQRGPVMLQEIYREVVGASGKQKVVVGSAGMGGRRGAGRDREWGLDAEWQERMKENVKPGTKVMKRVSAGMGFLGDAAEGRKVCFLGD